MLKTRAGDFRPMFLRNPEGDGAAGGTSGDGTNGNGSGEGGAGGQRTVTFTPEQQKVIDGLLGERAKRAEQSAVHALLKEFGAEKPEELKAALDEFKKLKAAQLSELEKAQQAAADAQTKIDAAEKAKADALAQAQTKLLRAAVIAEAVRLNFDEAEISSVWLALQQDKKLLDSIKPKPDADDEFDGVAKAVEAIAAAHPKWLKTATSDKADINARNRSGGKTETDEQRKAREAELRARFGIRT